MDFVRAHEQGTKEVLNDPKLAWPNMYITERFCQRFVLGMDNGFYHQPDDRGMCFSQAHADKRLRAQAGCISNLSGEHIGADRVMG